MLENVGGPITKLFCFVISHLQDSAKYKKKTKKQKQKKQQQQQQQKTNKQQQQQQQQQKTNVEISGSVLVVVYDQLSVCSDGGIDCRR